MSKAEKIKSIIKKDPKPSFGSDPSDPWATRSNLSETALLDRYLKSRGINPKYANKDTKVAHSKTNAFKAWLSAHMSDPIREEGMTDEHTPTGKRAHALRKSKHYNTEIRVADGHKKLHSEEVDEKDTVTMDIPLLIRVLELAREDLKSDADLHRVVEKLIEIRNKGTLTMDDYDIVAHIKEEYSELINELSPELLGRYKKAASAQASSMDKKAWSSDTDRETSKKLIQKSNKRFSGIVKATKKQFKEDTYQDTQAATQMPFDTGNSPAEEPMPIRKREYSKSARIIKSIYKKKGVVREDLYDHEKEDKSVASYGRKPKVVKTEKIMTQDSDKPKAAAVLSGGTTMTGQKRDTVEIDPALKVRPGQTGMEKPQKDKY